MCVCVDIYFSLLIRKCSAVTQFFLLVHIVLLWLLVRQLIKRNIICCAMSDWFAYLFGDQICQKPMRRPNGGRGGVKGERGKSHVLCVFL